MNIAFIHPDLGLGGAERLVVDAALCLRSAGHRVTIFTAHRDPRHCFEETRNGALDVRVHGDRLPAHVGHRLQAPCAIARMAYLAGVLAVRGNGDRFDVVVCDLVAHAIPALRLLVRVPIVFYCHFPDLLLTPPRRTATYRAYRRPIDWLETWGLGMADRVLVNSRFTAQRMQEAFPRRNFVPQVLHPGVDDRRYAGAAAGEGAGDEQGTATVLSVARYVVAKNVGLAIEAFACLRTRVPMATFDRWRLVVAGGYDERRQECRDTLLALQTQARELGLTDRIQFLLSITDAERLRLLAQCRCVVYTPVDEHFGFVPLEAMASGRPVIAVDGGGVRETVRHSETGLLCAPNAEAFADALASLMSDPTAACRMGHAGSAHVAEHFSHRVFGARLDAILQDVVEEPACRSGPMLSRIRKCLEMLAPRERRRWAALIPLAIGAAGLEAVGAAAVFALVKIVGDPSHAATLPLLAPLARWHDGRATVLVAAVAVGLFYVFKNVVLTVIAAVQSRVINDSIVSVSRRMLEGYLAVPFVTQARRNSSELIRNSTYSVNTAFGQVMEAASAAITESCIVAAIIVVLMIKAPVITLVAGVVLCTLLAVLLMLTRNAVARWGRDEQQLRGEVLKTLQQTFHGLKEIKIRGREQFYYESFSGRQRALARLQYLNATLATVSRLLVETVFICGVLLVIALTTLRGGSGADVVPLLGLYAYAGFRVIPSINRILMYLGRIQNGSAAVDALYDDFMIFRGLPDEPALGEGPPITFTDRLVLTRVSFAYGTQAAALQDIDLTVVRGESLAVVGPTGAGKSTLIDVILGLLRPSAGQVAVDGSDIFTALRSWQGKIGYVPQAVYLMDDSLRRNVAFGLPDEEIDDEKLRVALQMAQLDDVVAALPNGVDTVVGERGARLSGGERQRVAIARALYHQPDLLVFDEATSALDSQTERELTVAIESLHGKKTLIIIAHRLSTVRSCDRIVFLRAGRVEAEGSFDELLERHPQFRTLALADLA